MDQRNNQLQESSMQPSGNKDGSQVTMVIATVAQRLDRKKVLFFNNVKVIGTGSFGVVYQARLLHSEDIAIKVAKLNPQFKNRELQIMRRLDHINIVQLKYFFFSSDEKKGRNLNLVMEYLPDTLHRVAQHYSKAKQMMPVFYIKLLMYQLFRGLEYLHANGVCHRDIKPQNLLLNPDTGVLKLCDFGSAKELVKGEPSVIYICSRYYRAPELIFGSTDYTIGIDVWSAGCVHAELLLGQPIFPGDDTVGQLVEIIKVLGTPTREEIIEMNPNYMEFKFPHIKPHPWPRVFRPGTPPEAIDLVANTLQYVSSKRMTAAEACVHPFFNEVHQPSTKMPNRHDLLPIGQT